MILQALCEYYQRKAADPESGIAPEGFEWKEIPFIIVIDMAGDFIRIEDTREGEGRARRGKKFLVPQGEKKTAGIKANLLWDGPEYVLGANPRGRQDAQQRHSAFIDRQRSAFAAKISTPIVAAMMRFLETNALQEMVESKAEPLLWKELLDSNSNTTLRIEGMGHQTIADDISQYIRETTASAEGLCLIRGEQDHILNLNPAIKGVREAQSSGAALVSFNLPPFRSYGKEQNANAPIGRKAVFAYTTALNWLLSSDLNRLQIGDATTVFWAQKPDSVFEKEAKSFFFAARRNRDDPDRDASDTRANLLSVLSGIPPEEMETTFFILGLSPNAARISVRFWHQGRVSDFCARMREHFADLDIIAPAFDPCRMSLQYLLGSTVRDWKSEDIPPNLAGDVMRAVLGGGAYPAALLQHCVRRIRAEQGEASRVRSSILKASLNRRLRISNPGKEKEITVALDPDNMNQGYRLGRLFAVLEKIQEDANPGLNATIRDRYYGAASSTPVSVFPQLFKLKNHHLSKLDNPAFKGTHEKRLAEIIGGLGDSMPGHLCMDDQARFAIGYYHQRQAFFTSGKGKDSNGSNQEG